MSEQDNLQLMKKVFDASNAHDIDRVIDLCDDAVVAESDTLPESLKGREALRRLLRMYSAAFPDARYEIDQMMASGDSVVTRGRVKGTHRGEFKGFAPTNRPFELNFCRVDQFRNGKIVHFWSYWDTGTLMRQLGLLEMKAAA